MKKELSLTEILRQINEGNDSLMIDDEDAFQRTAAYRLHGDKGAGAFWPKTWKGDGELVKLDSFDKNLVKDIKLKSDERIFRYETTTTKVTGLKPLVKINFKKGLVYFLTQDSAESGEFIEFETRGVGVKYMRVRKKAL